MTASKDVFDGLSQFTVGDGISLAKGVAGDVKGNTLQGNFRFGLIADAVVRNAFDTFLVGRLGIAFAGAADYAGR